MDPTIKLALETIELGKQAIVFCGTKSSAEKTAEEIAKKIKVKAEKEKELLVLSEQLLHALDKPTKQCERLAKCVKKGIAFHHAGLVNKQRKLIEDNFRNGTIKIICATPTLAYGVDLPAFRVIIKTLRRYEHGYMEWIPTLEYLQMAGRAGRPKYDKIGEAIAIATTEAMKDEIIERYIHGLPEEIVSKLAVEPVLRMHLLALIATGFVRTKNDIIEFFKATFWAKQFSDFEMISAIIERMLNLLVKIGFVKKQKDVYRATRLGLRVSQLYIDPLTAYHIVNCIKVAEKAKKEPSALALLQMISHTAEMRPLPGIRAKEYDELQEFLFKYGEELLEKEPSMWDVEYEDFLSSVKLARLFLDWINEVDEEVILERYKIRPGETRAKLEIADWLLYSASELAKIIGNKLFVSVVKKLRLRMKYGVKEELLELVMLKEIGRVRARMLYSFGIKSIPDLRKIEKERLEKILGKKIAEKVLSQIE